MVDVIHNITWQVPAIPAVSLASPSVRDIDVLVRVVEATSTPLSSILKRPLRIVGAQQVPVEVIGAHGCPRRTKVVHEWAMAEPRWR